MDVASQRHCDGKYEEVLVVLLASVSDSPLLDTRNPNLTIKQRFEAKERALKGGLDAMAVNVLSSKKLRMGQHIALYVASRAL